MSVKMKLTFPCEVIKLLGTNSAASADKCEFLTTSFIDTLLNISLICCTDALVKQNAKDYNS